MARYIDANKLKPDTSVFLSVYAEQPVKVYSQERIDNAPTEDVAPVKHGHFRRLTFSGDTIICSECKMAYNIFETNGAENFNFCPHCGAKIMDGGEQK